MSASAPLSDLQGRKQLRLRLRRNLLVVARDEGGHPFYVIKDPITLRYFRIDEGQHFVLGLLDGSRSLGEVQQIYEEVRRPERVSLEELEAFAAQLVNNGLAGNETPLAGQLLWRQTGQQQRERRRRTLLNFLAVKVPLFDPDVLLGRLLPWVGFLFRPLGVLLGLALLLLAAGVLLSHWSALVAHWPVHRDFFTPTTALYLGIAFVLVKVLHEFGHGLSCRAQGGEVHEMGVLLLLFFPALYCNVSDAWRLPGRWQRIGVAAAGVWVELLLAAMAALVWRASEPSSQAHHLAFAVLLVCGVSTLIVNANPLLRYDGYYALADYLEIANLSEAATGSLRYHTLRWLGVAAERPAALQGWPWFLPLYAIASFVCRWGVLAGTFYVLYLFLEPYRLGVLSLLACLATIAVAVVLPAARLAAELIPQRRWTTMNGSRVALTALGLLAAVAFVALVPLPRRVEGLGLVQIDPGHLERVSVPESGGFLTELRARDGQAVRQGQVLAILSNPKLDIAIRLNEEDLRLREGQQQAQVALLAEARRAEDGAEVERTGFELRALRGQGGLLRGQRDALTLRAGRDGVVLGLRPVEDLGRWLERGTELCRIGDPEALRVVLVVEPSEYRRIRVGSRAVLHPHGGAGHSEVGVVSELAQIDAASIPPQLSSRAGGEVATEADAAGRERPRVQHYLVAVRLARPGPGVYPGSPGRVAIDAEAKTLGWHLRRALALTFGWGL